MANDEAIIFAYSDSLMGLDMFDEHWRVDHQYVIAKGDKGCNKYMEDSYGIHLVSSAYQWEGDWFLQDFLVAGTSSFSIEGFKRVFNPLRIPDLWIKFAQLEPNNESIVSFASEFGRLGGKAERTVTFHNLKFPQGFLAAIGRDYTEDFSALEVDSIEVWMSELRKIKRLFKLWELLEDEEYIKLSEAIKADSEYSLLYTQDKSLRLDLMLHPDMWKSPLNNDVRARTKALLHQEVGRELRGTMTSRLIWDNTSHSSKIVFSVESLLEAIWLQFAQALEGNSVFHRCEACGTWLAIRKGERTDRRFCNKNSTCRARVSAKRKNENPTKPKVLSHLKKDVQ
jgi:hypothetical protein